MIAKKDSYCAVIGDIVDSRNLNDRGEVTAQLKQAIADINLKYSSYITADFSIYAGDEIQGLLSAPGVSYKLIQELKKYMKPIKLVFGVGVGPLATEISKRPITWELDGKVYHRAREMVNRAKKKKPSICYCLENSVGDLINSLIYFIESNREFRTKHQQKVVTLYKKYGTQKKVAERLDISQATVSSILNKALFQQVNQAEENINSYLNSLKI